MEKILIIDDDHSTCESLEKTLTKESFQVLVAHDGVQGLDVSATHAPGIVITDLRLPGMNGLEVLCHLKRQSFPPEVILTTAYGDYDTVIGALRGGATEYLKKPIDLDELLAAINRCATNLAARRRITFTPTILLIEDEDLVRHKLARVLEREHWNVVTAANGVEGLEVFDANPVDVALVDIQMPYKNGLEVLAEIKQRRQDCEVMVLTGYGDEESAVSALRAGAVNFLKKPIDLDQMVLAVEQALEKIKLKQSLLYRTKDSDLAWEILAAITRNQELIVSLQPSPSEEAQSFTLSLLEAIPFAMLVFDQQRNIIFSNQYLQLQLGTTPQRFDQKLLDGLSVIGIRAVSYDDLKSQLAELASGKILTIPTGRYASITLTKIALARNDTRLPAVLVVLRGERAET